MLGLVVVCIFLIPIGLAILWSDAEASWLWHDEPGFIHDVYGTARCGSAIKPLDPPLSQRVNWDWEPDDAPAVVEACRRELSNTRWFVACLVVGGLAAWGLFSWRRRKKTKDLDAEVAGILERFGVPQPTPKLVLEVRELMWAHGLPAATAVQAVLERRSQAG